jgi:DNA polymerase sigma
MAHKLFFSLRREVSSLIQLQIQTLALKLAPNSSELQDRHARFERIMDLQDEVARQRKESIIGSTRRL